MALGTNIKERLREIGQSESWLAGQVPMNQQALNATIRRDSKASRYLSRIAEVLKVTEKWLQTGQGPKERVRVNPYSVRSRTDEEEHDIDVDTLRVILTAVLSRHLASEDETNPYDLASTTARAYKKVKAESTQYMLSAVDKVLSDKDEGPDEGWNTTDGSRES